MREDRLRALRAIRFAARFDFTIDDATRRAIESSAPHLGRLSPERVKQELDKTMEQVRHPSAALRQWQSSGAFASLVPALAAVPTHAFDVIDFSRDAAFVAPAGATNASFRWTVGGAWAKKRAGTCSTSLRASRSEIQTVTTLVDAWHRHGESLGARLTAGRVDDQSIRRLVAEIGRLEIGSFMRLATAIWDAARARQEPAPDAARVHSVYRRMVRSAFRDPIDLGALAVDGDDLRRVGIPPGRSLGKILKALLEMVIADPAKNTADLSVTGGAARAGTVAARGERPWPERGDVARMFFRGRQPEASIWRGFASVRTASRSRKRTIISRRTSSQMPSVWWICSTT
jgi:tRNA nucleotidyltransferase (CCA-adding enzyme)